jgi:hypothetical protein
MVPPVELSGSPVQAPSSASPARRALSGREVIQGW